MHSQQGKYCHLGSKNQFLRTEKNIRYLSDYGFSQDYTIETHIYSMCGLILGV